jgi:carbamoyltransferase
MIEWGISAGSHNAALAVFKNKELVFASESERYSKIKNDPDLNIHLVHEALSYGMPSTAYWYEYPLLKFIRQIYSGQYLKYFSVKQYLNKYDIKCNIKTSNHHLCHASAGYFTSHFDDACILVIDAIGEFETLSIWRAHHKDLKKVYSLRYPNSIGLWYSAMTQRCGLKPNEEEYILMGMSALGNPKRLTKDIITDFIDLKNISIKKNLHRGCLQWRPDLTTQQDIYDIAAATQHVYQKLFNCILKKCTELTNSKNLVLVGGCALNCVANNLAYNYFKNVWIIPAPGDSGSAIGSFLAHHKEHIHWPGPFLGHNIVETISNDIIVNHLLNYGVCGIARGKAEFGPRSLGNRSLIADPRGNSTKDRVNDIKHREKFRPFAPVILEEHASNYFTIPKERNSPYMQFTYQCLQPHLYPAIVHYDYSSRVQTVGKDGSLLRDLLEKWYNKTGCPMLLNTSLNIKGQPIINDLNDVGEWEKMYGVKIFS